MAQLCDENKFHVLMVSTEYPPMKGGVGRYTSNLTRALQRAGVRVEILCNEQGKGDFHGLSPSNQRNSEVILNVVKDAKPDLIHVQYEHGLYGLSLDPIRPYKSNTNIDHFYEQCDLPIVTTFHSAYTYGQWMKLVVPVNFSGHDNKFQIYTRMLKQYWKHLLNYRSFHFLNKSKLGPNRYGVVFSKYLADRIPGTQMIYHGSEPYFSLPVTKRNARKQFSIPENCKIALALGFETRTKGWNLINKLKVPRGWKIVINSSKNHYNIESTRFQFDNQDIIDLGKGYLNDLELSYLLCSADILLLPYKVSSASGVMFDGISHGLPFVSSDIAFFQEFSSLGLGISVRRNSRRFSEAILAIENQYEKYRKNVDLFKEKLAWSNIAELHKSLYHLMIEKYKKAVINCQ